MVCKCVVMGQPTRVFEKYGYPDRSKKQAQYRFLDETKTGELSWYESFNLSEHLARCISSMKTIMTFHCK